MLAIRKTIIAPLALAAITLWSAPASAVLPSGTPGLEVTGKVDLDAFGPQPPISNLADSKLTTPFARSIVSVMDASPGLFSYGASSDIGNLALKAAGSLTNGTLDEIVELESGLRAPGRRWRTS